jgi:hypothetical protein
MVADAIAQCGGEEVMTKYAGEASHEKALDTANPSQWHGLGGGMSASENRMVNHAGKNIASKGPPKDTSRGANLGKNATNRKAVWGCNPAPASPNSEANSRNKSRKTGGY